MICVFNSTVGISWHMSLIESFYYLIKRDFYKIIGPEKSNVYCLLGRLWLCSLLSQSTGRSLFTPRPRTWGPVSDERRDHRVRVYPRGERHRPDEGRWGSNTECWRLDRLFHCHGKRVGGVTFGGLTQRTQNHLDRVMSWPRSFCVRRLPSSDSRLTTE